MFYLLPVFLVSLAVFLCLFTFKRTFKEQLIGFLLATGLLFQSALYIILPPVSFSRSVQHSLGAVWYQGGNLQKATWQEWQKASEQNRLATAADYLKQARLNGLFTEKIRSIEEYRPWAAALLLCLDAESLLQNGPKPQALVRQCLVQKKLHKYLKR
jgi:hypothetical protein